MRPILFKLGPVAIHSYGVMLVLAFVIGTLWGVREARRRGLAPERMVDAGLAALVGGLIGARILYIALDPAMGWHELPFVWRGGLSFHGGVIGGVAAVMLYALVTRTPLGVLLDSGAPGMALGYAIARIGCLLNGCCYGCPTAGGWGLQFHNPATGELTPPSHPAQLYASAGTLVVFAALLWLRPRARFSGQLFIAYLGLYGILRFAIEFFRKGVTAKVLWAGLTEAQVASIGMIALGVAGWLLLGRRGRDRSAADEHR